MYSQNHCCHGNATMCSICIAVDLHVVVVNNIKLLSFAMETQEWVPFTLLPSYKIFRTAINNINILRFSRKVSNIIVHLNKIWCFSTDIHKNPSIGSCTDTCGHTDGQTDVTKLTGAVHYLCECA